MTFQNFWLTPEECHQNGFIQNECEVVEMPDKYNEPENEGAAFYNPRVKSGAIRNTNILRYLVVSTKFMQNIDLFDAPNLESFFDDVCFQTDKLEECFEIDPAILGEALIFDTKFGKNIYLLKQEPEYQDAGMLGLLRVARTDNVLKYYKKR